MLRRCLATSTTLPPTIRQLLLSESGSASPRKIQIAGWIKSVRRQKNVAFALVNDGSSARGLQAVFPDPNAAKTLTNGASVRLAGRLVKSPGPGQDRELQVEEVEIVGECDPEVYPMQKQAMSVEHLREHCHLRPRADINTAMLRLRSSTMISIQDYFNSEGFCYVHTPILTSNDCEGAGETFRVTTSSSGNHDEFFPKPTFLTVSTQLHLEALASALSRTYTLSPCFRSERSMTNRHLAEFWMLEAEWAFAFGGIKSVCDLVQESVKRTLRDALQAREDLDVLWRGREKRSMDALQDAARPNANWTRMTYTDAVEALRHHHSSSPSFFEFEPSWGKALQSEHERWLAEQLVNGPLFVTDYPASLKPFYMRANDDGKTVACFDLLIPHVGELAGGSVREERLERLVQAMTGLSRPEEYDWYLDLRRFGNARSAGFGLGFERLIAWLSGIENVRECIAMPRWTGKILL